MDYYEKTPSLVNQEVDDPPWTEPSFTTVQVSKESARTLVNKALKILSPGSPVVFVGIGRDTHKAVTCAELIKVNFKKAVHQITRVTQMQTTEVYSPTLEGLDPIRVCRSVPIIHILVSLDPLESSTSGYQKSNAKEVRKLVVLQPEDVSLTLQSLNISTGSSSSPRSPSKT